MERGSQPIVNANRAEALTNSKCGAAGGEPEAMDAKHLALGAGLAIIGRSGLAHALRPAAQGLGAILMLHHVRPYAGRPFDPHRGLEIEPAFLDAALDRLQASGFDIVAMDDLPQRLTCPPSQPFVAITFDDGYRDNLEYALPILRRRRAPFTVYATTGFADGEARLWWRDLADAVEREHPGRKASAMRRAYAALYADWRARPDLLRRISERAAAAGAAAAARTRALCLDWRELRALAADPLCTIGAHTLTHPILAALDPAEARREIVESKALIEERIGAPIRHFAYPVGDSSAAGPREFALAREAGYATGVTTRPGMLFPDHAAHLHALPRLSLNGWHQSIAAFDALLTGAPFWLVNRGRRLNVG